MQKNSKMFRGTLNIELNWKPNNIAIKKSISRIIVHCSDAVFLHRDQQDFTANVLQMSKWMPQRPGRLRALIKETYF